MTPLFPVQPNQSFAKPTSQTAGVSPQPAGVGKGIPGQAPAGRAHGAATRAPAPRGRRAGRVTARLTPGGDLHPPGVNGLNPPFKIYLV